MAVGEPAARVVEREPSDREAGDQEPAPEYETPNSRA